MASFDFNTEVSVNILGHIFEQSISDLEELKEDLKVKVPKDVIVKIRKIGEKKMLEILKKN